MYICGQNLGFPMSLESQVELTPSEDAEGEGRDCLVMSSSLRLRFLLCLLFRMSLSPDSRALCLWGNWPSRIESVTRDVGH